MKLRKKFQGFFALARKRNGGFTLVELIVVIAILAILGGVAVPAYSGYVKKADLASDQTLLAAVNKAFAAACTENGTDQFHVEGQPALTLTAEKAVQEVNPYKTEFKKYYAGNEGSKFKTDNAIVFDGEKGVFVLLTEGTTVSLKYGSGYVTVSAEDAKKLANSTFINADTLGAQALMDKVNFVADVASNIDGESLYNDILEDPSFQKAFLENLGITDPDNENAYWDAVDALTVDMFNKMAEENGWTEEVMKGWTKEQKRQYQQEATNKVKANMAVLYAAQNTKNLSDADINALLTSTDPKELIKGNDKGGGNQLAQASLYYGMYVAYANSSQGNEPLRTATNNPFEFFSSTNNLDTAGFTAYLNSDEGKADLEAYKASMNIVVDSTKGNAGAVNDVILNGFNDDELVDLINQVVGK